jgi:hypothetical protein
MARPIRVLFRFNGGFVMRHASKEENEEAWKIRTGIWEKWKQDPGITYIGYYLAPGVGHHIIFEVDGIDKVAAMDADVWQTKGLQLETYSLEIGLGNAEIDEWWRS